MRNSPEKTLPGPAEVLRATAAGVVMGDGHEEVEQHPEEVFDHTQPDQTEAQAAETCHF
jgi:hypothetical protein